MALYNQYLCDFSLTNNKVPSINEPLQKYGYQLPFLGEERVSYEFLALWRDSDHLPLLWAVNFPAYKLTRVARAGFLLCT